MDHFLPGSEGREYLLLHRKDGRDGRLDIPAKTVLPNNNAGIEANTLLNGDIVMVFNPQTKGRDPLAIGISRDGGKTWACQRNLQHGTSDEENGLWVSRRKKQRI